MFKKRSRNFRSRRKDSDSDDDKNAEETDCQIVEPPFAKKAEIKKKKQVKEKMVNSNSVLSFQNDEGMSKVEVVNINEALLYIVKNTFFRRRRHFQS